MAAAGAPGDVGRTESRTVVPTAPAYERGCDGARICCGRGEVGRRADSVRTILRQRRTGGGRGRGPARGGEPCGLYELDDNETEPGAIIRRPGQPNRRVIGFVDADEDESLVGFDVLIVERV